jgi:hypothetical protein
VAEFFDKSWVGRRPIEFGSSLGSDGALIEQQDFGQVVAKSFASLFVGALDRSAAPAATAAASVSSATVG